MSIILKSEEEINLIKQSGDILVKAIKLVGENIKPGVSLIYLDKIADEFIRDNGAIPACKNYYGFPGSLCLSVNEMVLHGIPNSYELKDGDIISVDCVVNYKGYYSDCTYTYGVGPIKKENALLIDSTKNSLLEAINVAKVGNTLGDIGYTIESYIRKAGYKIVDSYSGHGVGKKMHEDPLVLNYGKPNSGLKICNGLVIAIEPIVGATTSKTISLSGGYDIMMENRCMSAHFEATVGFYNNETILLTEFEKCALNS